MPFARKDLGINQEQFKTKLASSEPFVIVDVREPYETRLLPLQDDRVVFAPFSRLSALGAEALPNAVRDTDQEIIVVCQEGARSLTVTAWLRQEGWQKVLSLQGGVAGFAQSQRGDSTPGS